MKYFLLLSTIIINIRFTSGQSYYVSNEISDNFNFRCEIVNKSVYINSEFLDELDIAKLNEVNRITFYIPGIKAVYPLYPISEMGSNLIYLTYYFRDPYQISFISLNYNKITKSCEVIDSFQLGDKISTFFFTKPFTDEDNVSSVFSFMYPNSFPVSGKIA